ncbi:MAG: hypothetical protein EXS37_12700 [Opitutus sp.]|nr:hypothetical protein [Opitutus sp.]
MNTNAVLRELLHKEPFRPVRIELVNNEVIRIPHPDFASVPPSSTDRYSPFFLVYDLKGNPRHINPMLVSSIGQDFDESPRKMGRRR